MIIPEKTYTSNPFVDNVIYYAKYLAMNCTVKDEDEALANETKETLEDGEILISCVESSSTYEMFRSIPKEILEKYIQVHSNLDLYVESVSMLKLHLNHYGVYERTTLLNNLSRIAREVYSDHFEIMTNYLDNISSSWADDNRDLYDRCINETATYKDLFDIMPIHTTKRIIKQYLNNYDLDRLEDISASLSTFEEYVASRTDTQIDTELENISRAMRQVFSSHYEIMVERQYVRESHDKWYDFVDAIDTYDHCKNNTASYNELYELFPENELLNVLNDIIDPQVVNQYGLNQSLEGLNYYFNNISSNAESEKELLTKKMTEIYLDNYQSYLNFTIYGACNAGVLDYFELIEYLPKETQKMILNTQIEEYTNIEVYHENKQMLNSYLNTLSKEESDYIKESINKDMRIWYPQNHQEYNNYYRSLIGLPPVDSNSVPYEDTLIHSWDPETNTYKEFGDRFIKQLPTGIYPEIHWKQNIYEFDSYDVGILNEYGILDNYVAACGYSISDPRYRYLRYLADNKLSIYECRKALKFQLIGIPTVDDPDAQKRFVDLFAINRDYCLRAVYSDAYKFQSDYYDKFMIIFIIINTIMDMLSDITQMIIDREVFDARCIKWLFESFGVPYYSEIPIKYLRAMLKNLNLLLKYKSSTKNMIDICKLFGFSDVRVFGYYLFKQRSIDSNTGEYLFDENNDISYDLDELYIRVYENQHSTAPVDLNSIMAAEPKNGVLEPYKILSKETPRETGKNYKKRYNLIKNLDVEIISEGFSEFIKDTVMVKDFSGVLYMKLLDYQNYDEDRYTKLIKYEEDGVIKTKRIIKNDADVYVKNPDYNEFTSLKDTLYFKNIKANVNPAELKFIKVPIDEEITEYKNDPNYIISYDEITYNDEGDTWDGGRVHEELYQKLVEHEFNAVKSKYISVETVTDLTEQCFQVSYFYNMLFDNLYSEEALTVKVPYIKRDHEFRFMDIICYLFALMYFYNDLQDNIMYSPTQILYIKGYNFDEALNEIMNDSNAFTQEPVLADRENIFDVNERIAKDNYNYREMFNGYNIKGFNLEADIDELEKWLNDYCQMSLDDFVVDDSLTNFSQIITLRQFFTLNNSYYQKDIFKDNVSPLQYNQNIKYAYGVELYKKIFDVDLDEYVHSYVIENGTFMEVIDNKDDEIYVMDYNTYIIMPDGICHTLLTKYKKNNTIYNRVIPQYYYYEHNTGDMLRLFDDNIYIVDKYGRYIFSTDAIYTKDSINMTYVEVTNPRYFIQDKYENDRKRLSFGEYWIQDSDGTWILDPEQVYVWVLINGVGQYIKWTEVNAHKNIVVSEDDCWIEHSDGHFIKYTETDYYRTGHGQDVYNYKDGENTIFVLTPEECYVVSSTVTDKVDTDPEGVTRYFKKLSDFYYENNWIYQDDLYVYDPDNDEYIHESNLLSPNNCYYQVSDVVYDLVVNNFASYAEYKNPRNISNILVLQDDNDYLRLKYYGDKYVDNSSIMNRYVYNSNNDYVTVFNIKETYEETKSMIVVFNKEVTSSIANELERPNKYNPEITDRVWDENDWFYPDVAYANEDIGMSGENIWYYRKPGAIIVPEAEEEYIPVGSGFYMTSTAYIGDIHLEKGKKYYMAFDIETNFTGRIQIYNTADDSVLTVSDKVYEVTQMEKKHISQVFIANDEETPEIRLLIYDFENFPIKPGDYIIISNIRFVRAYSENFIAQDIPSYDKIQELYRTNEAIYKYITTCMAQETDFYKYNIYKKIYDSLMISKYNKEAFKIGDNKYAKTYTEFLENRDAVLYSKLARFKNLDKDTMHKEIADEIIEVTYAIDDCVDTYSYGFLYSYFPAVSANYIQQYITKLINWFKSWKVHLLGINTVYKLGDPWENTIKILEDQEYRTKFNYEKHNVYIHDTVKINPLDDTNISGNTYTDLYDLEDPTNSYKDKCIPRDRVRLISRTSNSIEYYDSNTELHLKFNNDEIVAGVDDTNRLKITSSKAGFTTANENDMIMTTEENEQQAFAHQIIDEINAHSSDYVEWRDLLDE